jgi:heptosyltransferase-2
MKILVIALSGIGDAIMFSPALAVLKKHLPDARVEMLVMFLQVEDIYKNNPNMDKIHFIDFLKQPKLKSLKEVLALRKNRYDYSIFTYPANRKEYNLIGLLIGAKHRLGHQYNHYSFSNFDFLNTELKQEIKNRHNVLENFDSIRFIVPDASESELNGYELYLGDEERKWANDYVRANNLEGKFLAGFHAGSATFKRHINKRWSYQKFAELARHLNKKHGALILLFGTEGDVNERIHGIVPDITLIPEPRNILESLALMEKCKLFVSNDTALMHLAAALKLPTVAIFAYTNHQELHPWMTEYVVVRKELECSPCFFNSPRPVKCIWKGENEFKCIKAIDAEEVMTAVETLIQEIPGHVKP